MSSEPLFPWGQAQPAKTDERIWGRRLYSQNSKIYYLLSSQKNQDDSLQFANL